MTVETMKVSYIPDGDTLRCFRAVGATVEEVRIRLAYIDAPEIGNPDCYAYAVSARMFLRKMLYFREPVRVDIFGTDHYGRLYAEVFRVRDDANLALRLVHGGYAALWQCPQNRGEYAAAQDISKTKRRGIWEKDGPWQTPWLYR